MPGITHLSNGPLITGRFFCSPKSFNFSIWHVSSNLFSHTISISCWQIKLVMKLIFLFLFSCIIEHCFSQDSTYILQKIYHNKLPKRLFRLKDTSNNFHNFYDYVKDSGKPYRVNSYADASDTSYNFIFVDSSLFFCNLAIRENSNKKKYNRIYRYWVFERRLYPLISTRKKLNGDVNHIFILAEADKAHRRAELFLLNH